MEQDSSKHSDDLLINEIDDALLDEIKLLSFENKDFSLDETKRIFDNLPNKKQLFALLFFRGISYRNKI